MSPRTGRPKTKEPKSIEVKARIDSATDRRLTAYCEKKKVTRTDVVREGIEIVIGSEK